MCRKNIAEILEQNIDQVHAVMYCQHQRCRSPVKVKRIMDYTRLDIGIVNIWRSASDCSATYSFTTKYLFSASIWEEMSHLSIQLWVCICLLLLMYVYVCVFLWYTVSFRLDFDWLTNSLFQPLDISPSCLYLFLDVISVCIGCDIRRVTR